MLRPKLAPSRSEPFPGAPARTPRSGRSAIFSRPLHTPSAFISHAFNAAGWYRRRYHDRMRSWREARRIPRGSEQSKTLSCCAGVLATACAQGKRTQHGKPRGVVSDDQLEAREGQAGRPGVAERFVVPLKPGNAGGVKGPQFKTDAISGEGPGDWATYQLRERSETAEGVARESKGVKSCPRSGPTCGSVWTLRPRICSGPPAIPAGVTDLHVRFDERDVETESWSNQ